MQISTNIRVDSTEISKKKFMNHFHKSNSRLLQEFLIFYDFFANFLSLVETAASFF